MQPNIFDSDLMIAFSEGYYYKVGAYAASTYTQVHRHACSPAESKAKEVKKEH